MLQNAGQAGYQMEGDVLCHSGHIHKCNSLLKV